MTRNIASSLGLCFSLMIAVLVGWQSATPPAAQPATSMACQFSAINALADIQALAAVPRPMGSPTAKSAREYLLARATQIGMTVDLQEATGLASHMLGRGRLIAAGEVTNVIAMLPGRDRTLPKIAIMAHYDSVETSPGAADDAAGVATALEIARAVAALPTRTRDVALIITDGEEAGLLGANAFFAQHPLARTLGMVINLEARGSAGRPTMFESSGRATGLVQRYRELAIGADANSAWQTLYRILPNDTDLTAAKRAGVTGLNFAFIGHEFDYHSPTDTARNLDIRSVQAMGDQVLPLVCELAHQRELPPEHRDQTFVDLPGIVHLSYPQPLGWLLISVAVMALAFAIRHKYRQQRLQWRGVTQGVAFAIWLMLTCAIAARLVLASSGHTRDWTDVHWVMAHFANYEAALGLTLLTVLCIGHLATRRTRCGKWMCLGTLVLGAIAAWLGMTIAPLILALLPSIIALWAFAAPAEEDHVCIGMLLLCLVVATVLQLLAPALTPLLLWPVAAAICMLPLLILLDGRAAGQLGLVLFALLACWPLAFVFSVSHTVLQGFGTLAPELIGLFALLTATLVYPLIERFARLRLLAFSCAAAALVLIVAFRTSEGTTERHPQLTRVYNVLNADQQMATRVAVPARLDDWTRAALGGSADVLSRQIVGALERTPLWSQPLPSVPSIAPQMTLTHTAHLAHRLSIGPASGGRRLRVVLKLYQPASAVRIAGSMASGFMNAAGDWRLYWYSTQPLVIDFEAPAGSKIDVSVGEQLPDTPQGIEPLPARPMDVAPFLGSDQTWVVTERTFGL